MWWEKIEIMNNGWLINEGEREMRINIKSLKYIEILQLSYFDLLSSCRSGLDGRSFSVSEGLSSNFGAIAVSSRGGGSCTSICNTLWHYFITGTTGTSGMAIGCHSLGRHSLGRRCDNLSTGMNPFIALQSTNIGRVLDSKRIIGCAFFFHLQSMNKNILEFQIKILWHHIALTDQCYKYNNTMAAVEC